jgi:hypothetical protein
MDRVRPLNTSLDNASAYDKLGRLQGTLSSSGNNGSGLDTVTTGNLNTNAQSSETYSLDA